MSLSKQKKLLRPKVLERRAALTDREKRSQAIIDRLYTMPIYQRASTVLFYVDFREEVQTQGAIAEALNTKRVAVPWSAGRNQLSLFHLHSLKELTPGKYGVPEPLLSLREKKDRQVKPADLDLVLVPGVAFDRQGNRLGYGKGYYDRFLQACPKKVASVGLSFDCQVVDKVPADSLDVPLDFLITETKIVRFSSC
ncbi:MAG: 5-formyltetrahydrofolate cyclo-ligase [Pirellulaceae bacterium]|nr:5-formyltetrahydrofolate cyclo-ligase [Pirellulaceae bacterium]